MLWYQKHKNNLQSCKKAGGLTLVQIKNKSIFELEYFLTSESFVKGI